MNLKTPILLIVCFLIQFFLQNCSDLEDYTNSEELKNRIQNENAYLPLAPDNSWVYENWFANKKNDGTYEYIGDKIKSEHSIESISIIKKGNETKYDYGFSPIDLGNFIGGFLGNFEKITKINGQYFKKSIIKTIKVTLNGTKDNVYDYKLDDQMFLSDDLQPGQLISIHKGTYGDESEGFFMEYEVKNVVEEVNMISLPENFANKEGIDDHLSDSEYTDILHTKETTKITKLVYSSAGGTTIDLKGSVSIPANSSSLEIKLDSKQNASGTIFAFGLGFVPIIIQVLYAIPGPFDIFPIGGGPYIRLYDVVAPLSVCPTFGSLDKTITIKGAKYEYISDQPVFTKDQYWVKGVGNIKTITSPSKLVAIINLLEGKIDPIKIELKSSDPGCTLSQNTIELNMDAQVNFNQAQVQIPISLGNTWYIQNLRSHSLRNTLN